MDQIEQEKVRLQKKLKQYQVLNDMSKMPQGSIIKRIQNCLLMILRQDMKYSQQIKQLQENIYKDINKWKGENRNILSQLKSIKIQNNQLLQNEEQNKIYSLLIKLRKIMFPINVPQLQKYLNSNKEIQKKSQQKNILFVIGSTGAGKSLIILKCLGYQLHETTLKKITSIQPKEKIKGQHEEIKVGSQNKSTTQKVAIVKLPSKVYKIQDEQLYVADCPGFKDTRSVQLDIANGISLINIIKKCKSVRLATVISKDFLGDKYEHLKEIGKMLSGICNQFEFEKISNSIIYILNKFDYFSFCNFPAKVQSLISSMAHEDKGDNDLTKFFETLNNKITDQKIIAFNPMANLQEFKENFIKKIFKTQAIQDPQAKFKYNLQQSTKNEFEKACQIYENLVKLTFKQGKYQQSKYYLNYLKLFKNNISNFYQTQRYNEIKKIIKQQKLKIINQIQQLLEKKVLLNCANQENYNQIFQNRKKILQIQSQFNHRLNSQQIKNLFQKTQASLIQLIETQNGQNLKQAIQAGKQYVQEFQKHELNKQYLIQQMVKKIQKRMQNLKQQIKELLKENSYKGIRNQLQRYLFFNQTIKLIKQDHSYENNGPKIEKQIKSKIEGSICQVINLLQKNTSQIKISEQDIKKINKIMEQLQILNQQKLQFFLQYQTLQGQIISKIEHICQNISTNLDYLSQSSKNQIQKIQIQICMDNFNQLCKINFIQKQNYISFWKQQIKKFIKKSFKKLNQDTQELKKNSIQKFSIKLLLIKQTAKYILQIFGYYDNQNQLQQIKQQIQSIKNNINEFFQSIKRQYQSYKINLEAFKSVELIDFIKKRNTLKQILQNKDKLDKIIPQNIQQLTKDMDKKLQEPIQLLQKQLEGIDIHCINLTKTIKKKLNKLLQYASILQYLQYNQIQSIKNIKEKFKKILNEKTDQRKIALSKNKDKLDKLDKDQIRKLKQIFLFFNDIFIYDGICQIIDDESIINQFNQQLKQIYYNLKNTNDDSSIVCSQIFKQLDSIEYLQKNNLSFNNLYQQKKQSIAINQQNQFMNVLISLIQKNSLYDFTQLKTQLEKRNPETYCGLNKNFQDQFSKIIQSLNKTNIEQARRAGLFFKETLSLREFVTLNEHKQFEQIIAQKLPQLYKKLEQILISQYKKIKLLIKKYKISEANSLLEKCKPLKQFLIQYNSNIQSQDLQKQIILRKQQIESKYLSHDLQIDQELKIIYPNFLQQQKDKFNQKSRSYFQTLFKKYEISFFEQQKKTTKQNQDKIKRSIKFLPQSLQKQKIKQFKKLIGTSQVQMNRKIKEIKDKCFQQQELIKILKQFLNQIGKNKNQSIKDAYKRKFELFLEKQENKFKEGQKINFEEKTKLFNHLIQGYNQLGKQQFQKLEIQSWKTYFLGKLISIVSFYKRQLTKLISQINNNKDKTQIQNNIEDLIKILQMFQQNRNISENIKDNIQKIHQFIKKSIKKYQQIINKIKEINFENQYDEKKMKQIKTSLLQLNKTSIIFMKIKQTEIDLEKIDQQLTKQKINQIPNQQQIRRRLHQKIQLTIKNIEQMKFQQIQNIKNSQQLKQLAFRYINQLKVLKYFKEIKQINYNKILQSINNKIKIYLQKIQKLLQQSFLQYYKPFPKQFCRILQLFKVFNSNLKSLICSDSCKNIKQKIKKNILKLKQQIQDKIEQITKIQCCYEKESKKLNFFENIQNQLIQETEIFNVIKGRIQQFQKNINNFQNQEKYINQIKTTLISMKQKNHLKEIAQKLIILKKIQISLQCQSKETNDILNLLINKFSAQKKVSELGSAIKQLQNQYYPKIFLQSYPMFELSSNTQWKKNLKIEDIQNIKNFIQQFQSQKWIPQQLKNMQSAYNNFKEIFDQEIKTYIEYPSTSKIIQKTINLGKFIQKNKNFGKKQQLIAYIFTILAINKSPEIHYKNKSQHLYLPHPYQILAIFLMLNLHKQSSTINQSLKENLVQVPTGEGKSLILVGLVAYLALIGHQVRWACYSQYLEYQYKQGFGQLFQQLKIKQKITFGKLNDHFENLLNQITCQLDENKIIKFNDLFDKVILKQQGFFEKFFLVLKNFSLKQSLIKFRRDSNVNNVLIIDEFDVLYNNAYEINFTLESNQVRKVIQFIWEKVKKQKLLHETVTNSKEFKSLVKRYGPLQTILQNQIHGMIAGAYYYKHDYIIHDHQIVYKNHNSQRVNYGYKTVFANCYQFQQNKISRQAYLQSLKITLKFGQISDRSWPEYFQNIFRVTSKITNKEDLKKKQIEFYTIPSIFKQEQNNQSFKIVPKANLYQQLVNDIKIYKDKYIPTICYFRNSFDLFEFNNSTEFKNYKSQANILVETESMHNIKSIINQATKPGQITLATVAFGIGIDFKFYEQKPEDQILHIIQSFLSINSSQEILIKGRTGRQGRKKSYSLIISENQFKDFELDIDVQKIRTQRNKFTISQQLQQIRQKKMKQNLQKKFKGVEHNVSIGKLLQKSSTKQNLIQIIKNKNEYQGFKYISIKVILALDATIFIENTNINFHNILYSAINQIKEICPKMNERKEIQILSVSYLNWNSIKNRIIESSTFENKTDDLKFILKAINLRAGLQNNVLEVLYEYINKQQNIDKIILISNNQSPMKDSKRMRHANFQNKNKLYSSQLQKIINRKVPIDSIYYFEDQYFKKLSDETKGASKKINDNDKLDEILIEFIVKSMKSI